MTILAIFMKQMVKEKLDIMFLIVFPTTLKETWAFPKLLMYLAFGVSLLVIYNIYLYKSFIFFHGNLTTRTTEDSVP